METDIEDYVQPQILKERQLKSRRQTRTEQGGKNGALA